MVKKERSCASTSPIRLRGLHRDSFNTIQIGIVSDYMPFEINEISFVAVGFVPRLFCL